MKEVMGLRSGRKTALVKLIKLFEALCGLFGQNKLSYLPCLIVRISGRANRCINNLTIETFIIHTEKMLTVPIDSFFVVGSHNRTVTPKSFYWAFKYAVLLLNNRIHSQESKNKHTNTHNHTYAQK